MSICTWSMKSRFQIGSNRPLANRKARMFCAASLPRKWSIRKICALVEGLVHRVVEDDRAVEVGAERLLHDDPGAVDQLRVAQGLDDDRGGRRGDAHVVDAPDVAAADVRLGRFDRLAQPLGAGRRRHVVEPGGEGLPLLLGERVGGELLDRLLGERRKASSSRSSSEVPTTAMSGERPTRARWAIPGSSLRRARSPVAPKSTMTCGSSRSRPPRRGRVDGDG